MRRSIALLVPPPRSLACGGGGGGTDRRTLVDSRDNYDPRSLDPALSTDVPTGRAVGYLFDGLTRFAPDAKVDPGARHELGRLARRTDLHLPSAPRRHLPRRHALRRAPTCSPAGSGRSTRSDEERRGVAPLSDQGRAGVRGRQGEIDRRPRRARTTPRVVVTLAEPLAIFPKLLAMPVAADRTANTCRRTSASTRSAPDHGSSSSGSTTTTSCSRRTTRYCGGAPKADSLRARIIAEPSTAVAEFESGNVDVLQIPPARERATGRRTRAASSCSMSTPALELVYIGINTTRGPLTDARVRQAINYAIDVNRIIERLISGRGELAAGVIPPALGGYDSTRTAYPYDPAKAKQLLARSGPPERHRHRAVDVDQSDLPPHRRDNPGLSRTPSGIRVKIVQRESAAARGAARKGQTDMILKDWYADYPDAEDFLYPLLHSANKGAGGNVSFYSNRAVRLARHRGAPRARRGEAQSRCTARPTRSPFATRRWCFCTSTTSCTPCSPGSSTSCRR